MLTVFVGTYNRVGTLRRTISSYRRLSTPHRLVIVNNGTDDDRALSLLDDLRDRGIKVYDLPECDSMEEATENFNYAIRIEYREPRRDSWFAVTEADVSFEQARSDTFWQYIALAKRHDTAVGPHLWVDSMIPADYPLRSRVLACETWPLYRSEMTVEDGVSFSRCQIDTTFHLFTARRRFDRLNLNPIRVAPPHAAVHVDWYVGVDHPTHETEVSYMPGTLNVGSWAKAWLRDFWSDHRRSPELAFANLMKSDKHIHDIDLCNVCFLLSWCFQYGRGCAADRVASVSHLHEAIPFSHPYYWPHRESWTKMIYENDFTGLGWR